MKSGRWMGKSNCDSCYAKHTFKPS